MSVVYHLACVAVQPRSRTLAGALKRRILSNIAMGQEDKSISHTEVSNKTQNGHRDWRGDDFVLEKSIFANIFEKDVRRVFIYKKAERLAKAIHLITPAFVETPALRERMDAVAVGLIDAAIRPPTAARTAMSHELLTLSSVLSIARTSGLLSHMNADLIAREAQALLQEVAAYEEPRLFLDDAPTLAELAKDAARQAEPSRQALPQREVRLSRTAPSAQKDSKGQLAAPIKDREEIVLTIIKEKGSASIKDISTRFRDVSEKTIQRELTSLVLRGRVVKRGERRWSMYSLS